MAILICGSECAPLSWDFFALHLIIGGVLWGALLVVGRIFALFADRDIQCCVGVKERVQIRQLTPPTQWHFLVRMAVAILQCLIFSIRTYTETYTEVDWLIDLGASALYFFDLSIAWVLRHLIGTGADLEFVTSSLIDMMIIGSVILMPVPLKSAKSWGSLSFLASLKARGYWRRVVDVTALTTQGVKWEIVDISVYTGLSIFFAASVMLLLERLGDPHALLRVNEEEWNIVAALYYVVMTVSKVGYHGLAPTTLIGRLFAIAVICLGAAFAVIASVQLNKVVVLSGLGRGVWEKNHKDRHVVIAGNLAVDTCKELIHELLHPDHGEGAETLHVVLLQAKGTDVIQALKNDMNHYSNARIRHRVHVMQGSVMDDADLNRVYASEAEAFFLVPSLTTPTPQQEDTETIIRCMAIRKFVPSARIIMILLENQNQSLMSEIKMTNLSTRAAGITCIALDQIKLGFAGKSCEARGFTTLMCNLVRCIGDDADEDIDGYMGSWQEEYLEGMRRELYQATLSPQYTDRNALFYEVVVDILERTHGKVYIVGIVEHRDETNKQVLVNPGPDYHLRSSEHGVVRTDGIFIAPDRESIIQCTTDEALRCGQYAPNSVDVKEEWESVRARAVNLQAMRGYDVSPPETPRAPLPEEDVTPRLMGILKDEGQRQCLRRLVGLVKQQRKSLEPLRPNPRMLARGGHIVMLCTGLGNRQTEEVRLGVEHFVRPLRPKEGKDRESDAVVPVVVVAPVLPEDWENVAHQREVYFLQGSPLCEFDVDRANVGGASAVFICNGFRRPGNKHVASEAWQIDAETVFCTRMIESRLAFSHAMVLTELAAEGNHIYIPVQSTSGALITRTSVFTNTVDRFLPQSRHFAKRLRDILPLMGFPDATNFGSGPALLDCFRQPRFASGQLLIGGVVTPIAANAFYNPSLPEMVVTMLSCNVQLIEVPGEWHNRTYFEYLTYLLWVEGALPIGILRQGKTSKAQQRRTGANESAFGHQVLVAAGKAAYLRSQRFSFVYTAPTAKDTVLVPSDRVICFVA